MLHHLLIAFERSNIWFWQHENVLTFCRRLLTIEKLEWQQLITFWQLRNAWHSFITCHTIIRSLTIVKRSLTFGLMYLTIGWTLWQSNNHDITIDNKLWQYKKQYDIHQNNLKGVYWIIYVYLCIESVCNNQTTDLW